MDHQNSLIQNYLTSFRPQNFSLPRLNPFVSLQQHQWFLMNQQQLWQNHFFCNSTPYNLLPTFPTYPSSLQGAGDGLSLETKENYDRNNNNLNSTRRSLSPPSVSFEDSFKVLPLQPEAEKYHRQILQIASEANRSTPKYEDLHYLGVPYASSLRSFQLFQNLEFNFGTPQKIRPFQHPRILKSEEYERVRQEFSYNGFVSVEENCNQSVASSSSTPFTFFGDSDFPPLEQAADKNFSSQFAAGCVDSMPMFNVNSAISASPLSRQLVKKDSNIDKSTTDGFCSFCKENGEKAVIYTSHTLKDFKGRVLCPVLRLQRCLICGADGDEAHLIHECPDVKITSKSPRRRSSTPKRLSKLSKKLR